jgi:hypothetical protein
MLTLAAVGTPSAAAAEPVSTVSGVAVNENGSFDDVQTIHAVSGTLSSGSGTVSEVRTAEFRGGLRPEFEFEGRATCVDASVVEGGEEATIGGVLTKESLRGNTQTPTGYFQITVIDGSPGGTADSSSIMRLTEAPGCGTEQTPLTEVPAVEGNGYTVTGAVNPQTRIEFPGSLLITEARPRFPFIATEKGATFECRFDEEAFSACSGAKLDRPASALSDGPHMFEVFATDRSGHVDPTPAALPFEIDTTPPETILEEGPSGLIATREPSWTFTSSEPGYTAYICTVDGIEVEGTAECFSPFRPAALSDGHHKITIAAVDEAGNVDRTPVKISITVDTAPPETSIVSSPTGPTKDPTPKIKFGSSEPGSSYVCRFDAESFGPCTSPAASVPAAPLADGQHEFEVEAIDRAGNVDPTPARATFTVDTTPPETTILGGGAVEGDPGTAAFSVEASEGTLECRLDAGEYAPCQSPVHYEALEPGAHTFRVRARDEAGNVDPTPAVAKFKVK